MPNFTPQQVSPEEGGTLCGTLGKAECEFVAAVILRWHHLNYDTDRWTKVLEQLEGSNPDMRANYAMFLDEYFT